MTQNCVKNTLKRETRNIRTWKFCAFLSFTDIWPFLSRI